MMANRNGVFGILMGATIGMCSIVLACGPPASCAGLSISSPLEDLTRCAELGDAGARSSLGWMYATGEGVPQDDAEAVRWYRLAAEQGYAGAQYNLGFMYATGQAVPEDDAEAARWYRLAAEQGLAVAQSYLGSMYANGEGVPEDLVYARMWFTLSAAQDNETAQGNKEIVEQRMTPEQIAEAQRLSAEWLEAHPPSGN